MSFIKSPDSVIWTKRRYKSERDRSFWRNGAIKDTAWGWPPSNASRWWSSRFFTPFLGRFVLDFRLSKSTALIFWDTSIWKSSSISDCLISRKAFFSSNYMVKLLVRLFNSYDFSAISPKDDTFWRDVVSKETKGSLVRRVDKKIRKFSSSYLSTSSKLSKMIKTYFWLKKQKIDSSIFDEFWFASGFVWFAGGAGPFTTEESSFSYPLPVEGELLVCYCFTAELWWSYLW